MENGTDADTETWITLRKIGSPLEKWVAQHNGSKKTGQFWKKWVTLGKLGHTWTNGSHFEKWVTLNWKNGSHLKNRSLLGKWVTRRKMCHTSKMGHTCKNGTHSQILVILL